MTGPAGNTYDKYGTRNPIARALMSGFLTAFDELVAATGARRVYEVGCGEGHLALRLAARGIAVRGCDSAPHIVATANAAANAAGLTEPPFEACAVEALNDAAVGEVDLLLCCEVLEHVQSPEAALQRLAQLPARHLLLSVPREPLWRALNMARGSYLRDFGNTPGHINHWSARGFERFVQRHCTVTDRRQPLPWTLLLCKGSA